MYGLVPKTGAVDLYYSFSFSSSENGKVTDILKKAFPHKLPFLKASENASNLLNFYICNHWYHLMFKFHSSWTHKCWSQDMKKISWLKYITKIRKLMPVECGKSNWEDLVISYYFLDTKFIFSIESPHIVSTSYQVCVCWGQLYSFTQQMLTEWLLYVSCCTCCKS